MIKCSEKVNNDNNLLNPEEVIKNIFLYNPSIVSLTGCGDQVIPHTLDSHVPKLW
jgi:hypothetical protein